MKRKAYSEMTTRELANATKALDEEMVMDQSRPLTAAERKKWSRVRRKLGRPKVGLGFQRISVSLEKGLLKKATALAKKRRTTRSRLLAQLLENELAKRRT